MFHTHGIKVNQHILENPYLVTQGQRYTSIHHVKSFECAHLAQHDLSNLETFLEYTNLQARKHFTHI